MAVAPEGFTQQVEREAFIAGQKAVSARLGALHFRFPAALLAAALLCGGVATVWENPTAPLYLLTAGVMILLGAGAVLLWFWWLPRRVKERAARRYEVYRQISSPARVTFGPDEMTVSSERLTRRVSYARLRACIEQNDQFVLCTDDGATVILRKDAFPQKEATESFLRTVCTRSYVKG